MKYTDKDLFFIQKALKLAKKAYDAGEVPVGALVVNAEGKILGQGYNKTFKKKSQAFHAEMIALQKAAQKQGDWRLEDCTLYVTLEPCVMCLGCALLSRIKKLVYSSASPLFGACQHEFPEIYYKHLQERKEGVGHEESQQLLRLFFKTRRDEKKILSYLDK